MISPKDIKQAAYQNWDAFRTLAKKLKKTDKRKLDKAVHDLHHEIFTHYDCLACANCCRSLGPRFTNHDIMRLSASLRIKESAFITKYLKIDEDGDYVFSSMPCPFLDDDNYCSVYNERPKACREYPHTDQPRIYQIIDLSLQNAMICPVVFEIFSQLNKNEK